MRVGISCYPTYGGSGIVATELAMALAEDGDEVHVISYALPSRLSFLNSRLFFHEVITPRYPLFDDYPPYSLALSTKMVEVARHSRLDVLHVHYAIPNAASAIMAREIVAPQPLPVVTTLHGTDVTLVGNDPNYLETTRWGIVQSDAVTAVSESLRRTTVEQLGIQNRIDVIPNFIDPARFERARGLLGARRWAKAQERILIHISNFRPVKRVLDVVAVFERVLRQVPSRLLMVGDGPDRGKVEQYCRDHGICQAITFIGSLPLIEEVLVGADLFLLPSETESFGLAALEAMACEVPVIATAVGGIPEVVVHEETGYLYPVGDVEGMAAGALRLLAEEPLRQAMGTAARRRAVEVFSQEPVVSRYRAIYERVTGAGAEPAGPGSR
ncbi:MAG TPA: N-acetyl-alpha-D-glucosaminyl L-malate synthase BshA [Thermoanaerobaculia bacterium]|nr:N-acetyl-alpha-D-glucosaminyl L-malate synthase BshA [Thermoanaerobaculia bacterium]